MPTNSSDPAAMFRALAQSFGAQQITIPVGSGAPFSVSMVHNVDTYATTYKEGSGRTMNGIVLVHDLLLTPSFGRNDDPQAPRITDYWVCVEPVRQGSGDVAPFGDDGHTPGGFSPIGAAGPYVDGPVRNTDGALMLSSAPPTTEASNTFSTGGSSTFSESVGFFGDTPTATATDSTTVSWGKSTSYGDVKIENFSRSNLSIVHYIIGSGAVSGAMLPDDAVPAPVETSQTTFQPELSQLFTFPDDEQTAYTRQGVASTGPESVYLFKIYVVARATAWNQHPLPFVPSILSPSLMWGYAQREIWVRQPPLPGQRKAGA